MKTYIGEDVTNKEYRKFEGAKTCRNFHVSALIMEYSV